MKAWEVKYLIAGVLVISIGIGISFLMAKNGAPQQQWIWCEMLKACQ